MSTLVVRASKPQSETSRALLSRGIRILPLPDEEGDGERFAVGTRVIVERRTGHGLVNGIMDKTLFTGAIHMSESYPLAILMVEGDVDYRYRRMNPQAVRGALSAMVLQYGINVLTSTDVDETAALILMFLRQQDSGIAPVSLTPKRKATGTADMQRRLVEMLPGCGMVMARQLLRHFGSVRRIAEATEGELQEIDGIGPRKARAMSAVLQAAYEALDTERDLEDAIEADPRLLLPSPARIVARQHVFTSTDGARHAIDLVFVDEDELELTLVELKLRAPTSDAVDQLNRYLDNAGESTLLRSYLERGFAIRGLLASVEGGDLAFTRDDIRFQQVDRDRAIGVLSSLRGHRGRAPTDTHGNGRE